MMGFVGYLREGNCVRIFLECSDPAEGRSDYSYSVDVIFQAGVELHGISDVLSLKKFYKLVFSLEERAREHGREWHRVFDTPEALLEHLAWTRNARQFDPANPPKLRSRPAMEDDPACYNREDLGR